MGIALSGCASADKVVNEKPHFFVKYDEPWAHGVTWAQEMRFEVTHDDSQPNDMQPYMENTVANSRVNECNEQLECKIIPLHIYLKYKIKETPEGYYINGSFITEATSKGDNKLFYPISVPFELNTTVKSSEMLNNKLGATLSMKLTSEAIQ